MDKAISFVGLLFFIGIAILLSKNKKAISLRLIVTGIALQFAIGLLILKSGIAAHFFKGVNSQNFPSTHL